jgi:Na+/H+ antiporter NhaC
MNLLWIIPPLATLLSAVFSKRVIPSIILGLSIGCFLKADGSILKSITLLSYYIVGVITDENDSSVIVFLFCFGALTEIFKVGGGISGFANAIRKKVATGKGAYLSVWLATPLTFLDCCFHAIATGIIAKEILEKSAGSRDKLAFIINITSSQMIPLIPIATTYVAYLIGILTPPLVQSNLSLNPYTIFLQAIPYNFYSITMVFFSLVLTFYDFEYVSLFHPAYKKMSFDKSEHQLHEAEHQHTFEEKLPPRIMNLILPLVLLLSSLVYLIWKSGLTNGATSFFQAMIWADYNQAILSATFITLAFTTLLYLFQKISMKTLETAFFSGGFELLPPIVIIVLAWSLALISRDLGFYDVITNLSKYYLPPQLIPFFFFAISGLTSYFIGSSWATWALILPITVAVSLSSGVNLPLAIGAVLAGGSIGDSISLLGEEPILVASTLDIPLTQHIGYTLPYGIMAAFLSSLGYLTAGYLFQ